MVLTFRDYQSNDIDFNSLGLINESHEYYNSVASVMDKVTFFVKRSVALEESNLNEAAKRAYSKDIRFNREERIAASCIFNEMLVHYEENMKKDLEIYEAIINHGSLLEEGVEYDIDSLVDTIAIDEGLKDRFKEILKKGKEGIANATKYVIDGAKDVTSKGIEVVKAKKDDLVTWAKQAKKDFVEKYAALKDLIKGIVKKGIDSASQFINHILEVFTEIGHNLVEVVKKLGGLELDEKEKPAELEDIEETDGLYKNMKSDGEKSFFNNIILRVNAILTKDKQNAEKLMTESYIEESIVDNKFIAWNAGYNKDGSRMSVWKTILIGLCASVVVSLLPKILAIAGLGGALGLFIAAFVATLWNIVGLLKLIYRRNKERKPGEKFFNWRTGIFFALSCVSIFFSAATLVKSFGPLLAEICNKMGWTGGDDMSKFGEFVFNLTKKLNPKACFQEGGLKEISEEIKNYGADVREGGDLALSAEKAVETMENMPGATEEQISAFREFLNSAKDIKGTSNIYKAWEEFAKNQDLPLTGVFDTSKWGGSGPIEQAIKFFKDSGELPESTILGVVGSEATKEASGGLYGFANYITGCSKDQMNMIFQKAAEIAGKDMSTLSLHTYGTSEIANIITTIEPIKGMFDVLTPNVPFLPAVMPFFDKEKWGQYKMRFASSTRGSAAYVVEKVDMLSNEDVDKIEDKGKALESLVKLHNQKWKEYNEKFGKKDVNESKKDEDKKEEIEEPKYIAFYINLNEKTGNESDKAEGKSEGDEKSTIGVIFDTLTMMCCDVCNFGKDSSGEIRRRPQPYFMKGLLSRLSFRPTKDKDNDTKDYIRTTLGQTTKTLITQCVLYGMGKKYIDSKIDGDKAKYELRERTVGDDKKINPNKVEFELGNFSPNELLLCLQDESKTNKVAYDFLDGKFATKISMKEDKNGNMKGTAVKDSSTIENVRYYKISKEAYQKEMDDYKKKLQKFKDGNLDDKPKKPTFIKGNDGEYYKRASKKLMAKDEYKRKRIYDFVDIRIIPLLKKGQLYDTFVDDEKYKAILYKEDDKNNVKLNKEAIKVLKPFLFRPELTFAKDDEHQLKQELEKEEVSVKGKKLGWLKNLFKDEEQIHDTFKDIIEIIWDYLSENRRKVYRKKDLKPNNSKTNEEYEIIDYTVFDELLEDFYNDEYDEETEYEYDMKILNEQNAIISYDDFLFETE